MRTVVIAMILTALRSMGAAAPPTATADAGDRERSRRGGAAIDGRDEVERIEEAGETAEADDVSERAAIASGDDVALAAGRSAMAAPPLPSVLAAAYASAGLDRNPGRGWVRRARLAGLIPWVTVRATRDTSWQEAHTEVGHGDTFEVRATWRLDRLLFDGRELQIATIEASRRRERQRLAARVIHCYFAWRRAATGAAGSGGRSTPRGAEALAELDALTDGWFSEELARLRQRAPRARPPPAAAP